MSNIRKIGGPCPSCELKDQNLVINDSFWCEHSDRLTRLLDTVRMSRQHARRSLSRSEQLLGNAKTELSEALEALKVATDALSAKSDDLMSLEGQLKSTEVALAYSLKGIETAERHAKRLKWAAIIGWILIVPAAGLAFSLH